MDILTQQLINGLVLGSVYALVALGYTMVYGVLKLINFAHGDMFMWGAYMGWLSLSLLAAGLLPRAGPWKLVPVMIMAMVTMGVVGTLLERAAYRPLRTAGRLPPIVSALGAAFVLESLARNLFGASYKTYPPEVELSGGINLVGDVRVSTYKS